MTREERRERERVRDRARYWANPEKKRAKRMLYYAKHKAEETRKNKARNERKRDRIRFLKAIGTASAKKQKETEKNKRWLFSVIKYMNQKASGRTPKELAKERDSYKRYLIRCKLKYHSDPEYKKNKNSRTMERRRANPEKTREAMRKYRQNAPPDAHWRIADKVRMRLIRLVKNGIACKPSHTFDLLGISWGGFKQYMEAQFKNGWTWENHGDRWHIDHILPCAAFDLKDPSQVRRCFHYSNLRPLGKFQNIRKGDTITEPQMKLLI